jgi:putative oxidoreductase
MRIASLIARILLGIIFVVFGLNGLHPFLPSPPLTGPVAEFLQAMYVSHYLVFTAGVQVIAGLMLLTNKFVPLALVTLGAVLSNILVLHITMYPAGLPPALLATLLWVIAALPWRHYFAPLFALNARPD